MAKTNVILEENVKFTVNEVEYTDKTTKETKTFNTYNIEVNGQSFEVKIAPADRKLFDYILGL